MLGIILVEHTLFKKNMYCILKYIKVDKKELPVIILNSQDEILEFDSETQAEEFKQILQMNSDSGYRYIVKKI